MAEFLKQEIRDQQEILKQRNIPDDSDSDSSEGSGRLDFEVMEAVRLSCRFESRSTTPTSSIEGDGESTTRPRASPDVVDSVIEKLRYAKLR
jgi:hypothetical protein